MRVLILTDARFAAHERALIERLMVGLAVEGVDARLVLPRDRRLEDYGFELISDPVFYSDRGLALTRRIRAMQIARQLAADFGKIKGAIDVIHVLGGGAWSMGRELARILDAGLVFEIWRAGLIDAAKGLHLSEEERALLLAPEKHFERWLVEAGLGPRTRLAPWGAQVPSEPVPIFRPDKNASIVMMSSGRQKELCAAAFEGLADAVSVREDVLIFANLELVERAGLWPMVKEHDLASRFTTIDKSEDRRDLLLRCDLMIYPDTLHEERTLLLDAMGGGMAIIAGADDAIAPIREEMGVEVVDRPTRSEWAMRIRHLLDNPQEARDAGLAAREYVKGHRRAGNHIEAVTDAYNAVVELKTGPTPASERHR